MPSSARRALAPSIAGSRRSTRTGPCRSTPTSRAMPGRPEPARPSSTCWSTVSTARPASGCSRACWRAIPRSRRARAHLSTRRLSLRWRGSGRRRQQPCRPGGGARLPSGALRRRRRRNRRRPRGARAAALPGRRGLCRRQRHAALGRRLVRPRRIDGRRHAHPLPLAVGRDRPAGGGLCRPPVLPLGLHGAAGRPHEHGRADLDRRHPGLQSSACTRRGWASSTPTSTRRSRCSSSC